MKSDVRSGVRHFLRVPGLQVGFFKERLVLFVLFIHAVSLHSERCVYVEEKKVLKECDRARYKCAAQMQQGRDEKLAEGARELKRL